MAYDANGDESLYLLGKDTAAQYDQSFRAKSALLADVPVTEDTVQAAANGSVSFHGFLGDELRNITFPGEKEAALDTLRWYGRYMAVDAQIRQLEQAGHHPQAVTLDIGTQPGQSDWAFSKFDDALKSTLDINQQQFDQDVNQAFAGLRLLPLAVSGVALLVIALTWVGVSPRIQEYRG